MLLHNKTSKFLQKFRLSFHDIDYGLSLYLARSCALALKHNYKLIIFIVFQVMIMNYLSKIPQFILSYLLKKVKKG
ncbi:hypothetical protein WA1_17640 [Scytonema hofmannii PCC 7110]|uniref:Uncharacterized protein n=1 Tax=Scytonema hofmannii PCC 7110 TaxID=128403 RepID=A0A139XAW5_9CYAN|nr:hypothetical protein WA1_17640 [Scytonema hofmannii PCC 7110]